MKKLGLSLASITAVHFIQAIIILEISILYNIYI